MIVLLLCFKLFYPSLLLLSLLVPYNYHVLFIKKRQIMAASSLIRDAVHPLKSPDEKKKLKSFRTGAVPARTWVSKLGLQDCTSDKTTVPEDIVPHHQLRHCGTRWLMEHYHDWFCKDQGCMKLMASNDTIEYTANTHKPTCQKTTP